MTRWLGQWKQDYGETDSLHGTGEDMEKWGALGG